MKTIAKHRENGRKNNIIIHAEGIGDTTRMAVQSFFNTRGRQNHLSAGPFLSKGVKKNRPQ